MIQRVSPCITLPEGRIVKKKSFVVVFFHSFNASFVSLTALANVFAPPFIVMCRFLFFQLFFDMTGGERAGTPSGSGSALLAFIARPAEDRFFDPMYALRLCSQHGRSLACVHLYSAMGLWEEAVDLALTGKKRE